MASPLTGVGGAAFLPPAEDDGEPASATPATDAEEGVPSTEGLGMVRAGGGSDRGGGRGDDGPGGGGRRRAGGGRG